MSEEERNANVPETPLDAPPAMESGVAEPPVESLVTPPVESVAAEPPAEPVTPPSFDLPPAEAPQAPPPPLLPAPAQPTSADVTPDDRLMAALAWVTTAILQLPIVSVVLLLAEGNKDRPFQRYHAVTSITFWVVAIGYEILALIAYTILGLVTFTCGFFCLWPLLLLPHVVALYYALQAYNGKTIEIPFISELVRKQGWA